MSRSTVARLLALTLVAGAIPPPSAAQAPQSGLRLLSREGTRTLPTLVQNNQEYVTLEDLSQVFGLTSREDQLAGGVTVAAGNQTIIVTPNQTVVSVAGRLVSLNAPPLRQGNRWLLPLDFLPRALGPALATRMDLRRPSRLLVIGDLRVPRVTARIEPQPAGLSVSLDLSPSAPARISLENGRLVVVFEADALDLALPSIPPQEYLQAIQPGDVPAAIRLVTGPRFAAHRATTTQVSAGTSRVAIELLAAAPEPAVPPTPSPAPAPADPVLALPPTTPAVRTVVIDPGHGGDEGGAQGVRGTPEKDLTLAVARRLRTMIEGRLGLRVFLTRDDDRLMSLDDRSAYANSQKADVFVSIHANAALRPAMTGAEVYFLSVDPGIVEARRMAETGAVLPTIGGGARAIDLIVWEGAQARYLDQSSMLAGMVEQALRARVPMSPRPVQQAPFRVLVGANMPAVLVEMGYLSNTQQEQAMTSGAFQDQVAQALFDAIVQFRSAVERVPPQAAAQRPQP